MDQRLRGAAHPRARVRTATRPESSDPRAAMRTEAANATGQIVDNFVGNFMIVVCEGLMMRRRTRLERLEFLVLLR